MIHNFKMTKLEKFFLQRVEELEEIFQEESNPCFFFKKTLITNYELLAHFTNNKETKIDSLRKKRDIEFLEENFPQYIS